MRWLRQVRAWEGNVGIWKWERASAKGLCCGRGKLGLGKGRSLGNSAG